MIEGEPKAPPAVGIKNIDSDLAQARERFETVETLVGLVRQIKGVSEMHAKLENAVKGLEKASLTSKNEGWRDRAELFLERLEEVLEQVKADPNQNRIDNLCRFLDGEVIPWLENRAAAEDARDRDRKAA